VKDLSGLAGRDINHYPYRAPRVAAATWGAEDFNGRTFETTSGARSYQPPDLLAAVLPISGTLIFRPNLLFHNTCYAQTKQVKAGGQHLQVAILIGIEFL
jgi:hypothetical protein